MHITHGESSSRRGRAKLYGVWNGIKQRTFNPNNKSFANYGGRGIGICQEWLNSYVAFRDWAHASGYAQGLDIDRIDNDRGYEPDNCRWVTRAANTRNMRSNRVITAFGEARCIQDWARDERCSVSGDTIGYRLARGWIPEEAIVTPPFAKP
jgi:hypothetical protein